MVRRVPPEVWKGVVLAVTLAILAALLGLVLNALAAGQPATCGGG
jgi:hypothetical protein